jgi:hypothetical protein
MEKANGVANFVKPDSSLNKIQQIIFDGRKINQ